MATRKMRASETETGNDNRQPARKYIKTSS
ncbi:MAG: hypothetical protein QOH70_2457, partial [Blastocatellia bacterium]|nr:hypothetical protein [Blastocatellia bacterium]